ncbi:MAG TPA: hypothetical protein VFN67_07875 [Polyangiales bacterium]|nr:hypothetical protein [Polyangiales bacterium]
MRLDYTRQFILESLQIADLGAAARHVMDLDLTGAFPVRFRCNGSSMANLAHKDGDDLIILDIPFWDRTDAELSSFQTHAGTIIHEVTHLNGVGHLPGCNVMSECCSRSG